MPNLATELVFQQIEDDLSRSESLLFVAYGGLTVAESEALRGKLAERGVRLRMVRNKLMHRVLLQQGHHFAAETLIGNVAIAMGDHEAAIVAAKIFAAPEIKKAGKVQVRAGLLEGRVLDAQDAQLLADIPDKDTLRSMILGCISGPARGLAVSIHALPAGLARVLQAHADDGGAGEQQETPA